MKARLALLCLLVAASLAAAQTQPPTPFPPQPQLPASKLSVTQLAINAVLKAQVDAWNRGDLEGYMQGYWQAQDLTFFSGANESQGWQATLERYRQRYQSGKGKMGKLTFGNIRIEPLGPNAAFVRGQWSLAETGDKANPHGLFTLIFWRTKKGWRIIHDHTS